MFCQNCGKKLRDGDRFCDSCGYKVKSEPETPVIESKTSVTESATPDIKSEPATPVGSQPDTGMKKPLGQLPVMIGICAAVVIVAISAVAMSAKKSPKEKEENRASEIVEEVKKVEEPKIDTTPEIVAEQPAEAEQPVEEEEKLDEKYTVTYADLTEIVQKIYDFYVERQYNGYSVMGYLERMGWISDDKSFISEVAPFTSIDSAKNFSFPSPGQLVHRESVAKYVNVTLKKANFPNGANFTGKNNEEIIVSTIMTVSSDICEVDIVANFRLDSSLRRHKLLGVSVYNEHPENYKELQYTYDERFNKTEVSGWKDIYLTNFDFGIIGEGDAYDLKDINNDGIPEIIRCSLVEDEGISYFSTGAIGIVDNRVEGIVGINGIPQFNGRLVASYYNMGDYKFIEILDMSIDGRTGNPWVFSYDGYINNSNYSTVEEALVDAEKIFGKEIKMLSIDVFPYKSKEELINAMNNYVETDPMESAPEWKKAYLSALEDGTIMSFVMGLYDLNDINKDGIPELILDVEGEATYIYTVRNNVVRELLSSPGKPNIINNLVLCRGRYNLFVYRINYDNVDTLLSAEREILTEEGEVFYYDGKTLNYDECMIEVNKVLGVDADSLPWIGQEYSLEAVKSAIAAY